MYVPRTGNILIVKNYQFYRYGNVWLCSHNQYETKSVCSIHGIKTGAFMVAVPGGAPRTVVVGLEVGLPKESPITH
jgi:hypothetical protein